MADVIPHVPTEPGFHLPDGARLPDPEDVDEEGYGFFRGVWVIGQVPRDEASSLLEWEGDVVRAIDQLADSSQTFDGLARVIEAFWTFGGYVIEPDEFPELTDHDRDVLQGCLDARDDWLDGIELGMAGLALVLAASGFMPVCSCRGHVGPNAWATQPSMFFAGDRNRIALLQTAVIQTGCQLGNGSGNGVGLVVVHAPSVAATMDLADAILKLDLPPVTADTLGG